MRLSLRSTFLVVTVFFLGCSGPDNQGAMDVGHGDTNFDGGSDGLVDTHADIGAEDSDDGRMSDADAKDSESDGSDQCTELSKEPFLFRENTYLAPDRPRIHPSYPGPCEIERAFPTGVVRERRAFEYTSANLPKTLSIYVASTEGTEVLDERISYTYSDTGRVETSIQDSDGDGDAEADVYWTHSYNAQGFHTFDRATHVPSGPVVWTYEYVRDACGRLLEGIYDTNGDGSPDAFRELTYNDDGTVAKISYYEGSRDTPWRIGEYEYDDQGRLARLTSTRQTGSQVEWELTYDSSGKRKTVSRLAGSPPELAFEDRYEYSGEGDLLRVVKRDENGDILDTLSYDYSCWQN